MGQKSDTIAVVTVHGTGDTATSLDGEKWFQRGSAFSERLKQRLAQDGVQAEIVPHLWSGANSAWERERGANKLAALIRRIHGKYAGVHIVGHSHGGNVANDAAVLLKWGLRRQAENERFDSLITVGTPFFDERTGWMKKIAAILFLIIAWGSTIAFPIAAGAILYSALTGPAEDRTGMLIALSLYIFVIAPCVLAMLNMSRQGIRRVLRPKGGGRTKTSVFAIWHENDEAISFLERVEELPVEAFPRGSLFRGSRAMAVGVGVLAVLAIALVTPLAYALHWADFLHFEASATEGEPISNTLALTMIGLLIAPAAFAAFYLLYRFIVGGGGEIGARGSMNRYVSEVLRGIAFGADGDQVLCKVGPRSHTHQTEELVLSGDLSARMQTGAHDAAGKLIDKYRWALFSVGGDSSASLTTLTTDAMTWESLIHTTYFDQPEVAVAIADYIAAKAKGETRAPVVAPPAPMVSAPSPAPPMHSEASPVAPTHSEALPAPDRDVHPSPASEGPPPTAHPDEPRPA